MSAINPSPLSRSGRPRPQKGAAAVEFALVVVIFLTLLFGILELARLMYLFNTFQEVTRRAASAAASADFSNSTAIASLRSDAIFSTATLPLTDNVTSEAVRIEYLSIQRLPGGSFSMSVIPTGSMPSSPEQNRQVCLVNPNADNCIRLVRVRICDPGNSAECAPVQSNMLFPIINLSTPLPTAVTIVRAESLGFTP